MTLHHTVYLVAALADRRPGSRAELLQIDGIGPKKVELYGDDVLRLLAET